MTWIRPLEMNFKIVPENYNIPAVLNRFPVVVFIFFVYKIVTKRKVRIRLGCVKLGKVRSGQVRLLVEIENLPRPLLF